LVKKNSLRELLKLQILIKKLKRDFKKKQKNGEKRKLKRKINGEKKKFKKKSKKNKRTVVL